MEVRAEGRRIIYDGRNTGPLSGSTLPYRHVVALLDTRSGVATLYDGDLFVTSRRSKLQQDLEVADRLKTEAAEKDARNNELTSQERSEKYSKSKALLGAAFGTRKTKSMLASLDRNRIDDKAIQGQSRLIKKSVNAKALVIEDSVDSNIETIVNDDLLLPPYNKTTDNAASIYPVYGLVPIELAEALKSAIDLNTTEAIHPLINSIISTEDESIETHVLALTLTAMIHFRTLSETRINSLLQPRTSSTNEGEENQSFKYESVLPKNLATSISPQAALLLGQNLVQRYSQLVPSPDGPSKLRLSAACRDRITLHCLIILLRLEGFRCNVTRATHLLTIPITRGVEYFRASGCTVGKPLAGEPSKYTPTDPASGEPIGRALVCKYASLTAPLSLPKVKQQVSANGRR